MADNNMATDTKPFEDLILTDDQLYRNNTFNLNALNDTLERLSVINYWNLYHAQQSRLKMKRFDIPFSQFINFGRLSGESSRLYFPKRYVAYVDYMFIEPELRKKYRNSEFYNVAIDQMTIANNPSIFRYNHMVFINGDYIYTTEVYPQDSKTGIIIDCVSKKNAHGITYEQWKEYKETNPMVTIYMVPNFFITHALTNYYALQDSEFKLSFDNIPGSEKFTTNTTCFANSAIDLSKRYCEVGISCNGSEIIVDKTIKPGGMIYRFAFITFNYLHCVFDITNRERYFRVNSKMPCPTEQMLVFTSDKNGHMIFNPNIEIKIYYPNIYEVVGLEDTQTARIFVFQDEEEVSELETYTNELAKYEEYISLLPKYYDRSISEVDIPDLIRHYRPSSFVYSIDDYQHSMYVPSTMNYKVQKLHKTIYENPWALATYLDILNLPTDKFYLDMEDIDLTYRGRFSTEDEDIDTGVDDLYFDEEHYVFAMNRQFINVRNFGFRIFIDGLFQKETDYRIVPGPNFYYIYIPSRLIKEDTVIEIERYKLYSFERTSMTTSFDVPVLEMDMSDDKKFGYSREIYVVDKETGYYLKKDIDFSVEVLYGFAERGNVWTAIPKDRNIPIENKFRVYLLTGKYLGKELKVGMTRVVSMTTGDVCIDNKIELNDRIIYNYAEVYISNQGGYDFGGYRVFNNGRLMLPNQYFITLAKKQGEDDHIRTVCRLSEDDQFTMDRVPCRFNVVYYQNELDVENKKGFVDLDGKIALPISLKWYDIYLNGVKLHKKNLEIISPTKFYVQGVNSRKHLMIVTRNRDPEVFRLGPDNSIMSQLIGDAGDLKTIIDGTKPLIDPNNETPQIATDVCRNLDALIFFFEHLIYTFLNANRRQITQEIKDTFPSLIDNQGIMSIDPNAGCIEGEGINGYLIKMIECNYSNDERSADMFTDESVNYDGLGTLQDRFAIRPLDISNYQFGLPNEFMCDTETGEAAIKNPDGTVTSVSTLYRTKNFVEAFSNQILLYGMGKSDVYQITMDDEFKVHVYRDDENLMTEELSTGISVSKFAIAVDASFLRKVGTSEMLKIADVNPMVVIVYREGGIEKTIRHKLNSLINHTVSVDHIPIEIVSIKLEGIPEDVKTFIHTILIAF